MYEQKKNELKLYLKPKGNVLLIVVGCFMLILGCFGLVEDTPIWATLLFGGVGLMLIYLSINSMQSFPQHIQALERDGHMPQILQDFTYAQSVFNDNLRFGQFALYARNQGQVLYYNDITRVYQHIHKTNFVEDRRELRYVNRKGQELTLCQLKVRGKSDNDVRMIVGMLLQKNPSIQVGYHKK